MSYSVPLLLIRRKYQGAHAVLSVQYSNRIDNMFKRRQAESTGSQQHPPTRKMEEAVEVDEDDDDDVQVIE